MLTLRFCGGEKRGDVNDDGAREEVDDYNDDDISEGEEATGHEGGEARAAGSRRREGEGNDNSNNTVH